MNTKMKFGRRAVLAVALVSSFLSAQSAKAALLNLDQQPDPDITSGLLSLVYDGSLLEVDSINLPEVTPHNFLLNGDSASFSGLVDIDVSVGASGVATSGSIILAADSAVSVDGQVFGPGTLLAGDLSAFGFAEDNSGFLDFRWDTTGGAAAGVFGNSFGTLLSNSGKNFNGWGGSFTSSQVNVAFSDTFTEGSKVPEFASTFGLMVMGFVGSVYVRSRRRAS